jgi:multidrug efflux pump subunit AcrB
LSKTLPEGTKIAITSDDAVFIEGAIHEVVLALVLAAVIVTAVIYCSCATGGRRSFRRSACRSR